MQTHGTQSGASINGRYLLNDPAECQIFDADNLGLSFEFFPPKSMAGSFDLFEALSRLSVFSPSFISLTYGAGGSENHLTLEAIKAVRQHFQVPVMAHLAAAGNDRAAVLADADSFAELGVEGLLALRGDNPKTARNERSGFASSVELISTLSARGWQQIRTTAYPDPHPESRSLQADIDWLKAKFDAGASTAITQFFFDADAFFRLRDACEGAGFAERLIPGILAFDNWQSVRRFSVRCGVRIPEELNAEFDCAGDARSGHILSLAVLCDLLITLRAGGVSDFHFYTLNKAEIITDVLGLLNVKQTARLKTAA